MSLMKLAKQLYRRQLWPFWNQPVVNDIYDIVKIVRFPDWQEVKKALRSVSLEIKYKIKDKELFDKAYSYVEMYY